ncbi:MAG: hypothetical protein ABL895_00560 [Cyclobacteriaceae bacterium]
MKKSKNIGVLLLVVFMGISAIPLFSEPTAPKAVDKQIYTVYFENGDDHASQWLIRSISESEEFNVRTAPVSNCVLLFACCVNYHSTIHKIQFAQTNERKNFKQPKERIYLSNSCFTI